MNEQKDIFCKTVALLLHTFYIFWSMYVQIIQMLEFTKNLHVKAYNKININ